MSGTIASRWSALRSTVSVLAIARNKSSPGTSLRNPGILTSAAEALKVEDAHHYVIQISFHILFLGWTSIGLSSSIEVYPEPQFLVRLTVSSFVAIPMQRTSTPMKR